MSRMTSVSVSLEFEGATQAQDAADGLREQTLVVTDKQTSVIEEAPPLPYTTLDMLEDAALLLGWGGRKTMAEAQTLFEQGRITYPRTDAADTAPEAVEAVRDVIIRLYGSDALPDADRTPWRGWAAKLRSRDVDPEKAGDPDQGEAHEAIRPTDPACQPDELSAVDRETHKLYRLIWQRFLASQMRPARYQVIEATFEVST